MGSPKQPEAPVQPSTADAVDAWVKSMPDVFAEQQRQAPLEAQQQVDLANQYAQPYAEALKTAQETLYPGETSLRNDLLSQAQEGIQSDIPDWMKEQYQSNYNANLGTNAGSPIGADYVSRGMLEQQQNWQNQYRNMAQSLIGTQPTFNAQAPQTSNFTSGFTPGSVMQNQAQNFGTQGNIFGTQGGMFNAQTTANSNLWGSALGAAGSMGGGYFSMLGNLGKKGK